MKANEILEAIKMLAKSQGFYGRLLNAIETSEEREAILAELESENFRDVVDMVMFYDKKFKYPVGDEIDIIDFDENYNVECSTGIHFFLTRDEAEKF